MSIKPVDLSTLLGNVSLTVGQVAKLAGVTVRQITYWTDKGYLKGNQEKGRTQSYDLAAVEKAILIKQLIDTGLTLESACNEAETCLKAGAVLQSWNGTERFGTMVAREESGAYASRVDGENQRLSQLAMRVSSLEKRLDRLEAFGKEVCLLVQRMYQHGNAGLETGTRGRHGAARPTSPEEI